MQTDAEFASKVKRYMAADQAYNGETETIHYLERLRDKVGFDKIAEAVKANESNPLKGKKIAAYYGCLLLRPSKVMAMDDAENPTIMEDFIKAIGATPVVYPYRNECCGGYVVVDDPASATKKSAAVINSAAKADAEMIVTACPLCKYNLKKSGDALPVVYLTELLAEALGVKEA
jgi:heterodisulfide reductase subunit B